MTIRNSIIRNNQSRRFSGGGVQVTDGTLIVEDSQILNNTGIRGGGGISTVTSPNPPAPAPPVASLTVLRSTIDGNKSHYGSIGTDSANPSVPAPLTSNGGGSLSSVSTLTNVTIANNSAPSVGGINLGTKVTRLKNVLLSAGASGATCGGTGISDGGNLRIDASCISTFNQSTDEKDVATLNLEALGGHDAPFIGSLLDTPRVQAKNPCPAERQPRH